MHQYWHEGSGCGSKNIQDLGKINVAKFYIHDYNQMSYALPTVTKNARCQNQLLFPLSKRKIWNVFITASGDSVLI